MNIEENTREALLAELSRQAEIGRGKFTPPTDSETMARYDGQIDVDELVMALVGALAGGP